MSVEVPSPTGTGEGLGTWRAHARLVGVASTMDLVGATLMGESRRVPRPLRHQWLAVVRRAQLLMAAALLGGVAAVCAQVLLTGAAWLAFPLCVLVLVPTGCQVQLSRRNR